MTEIPPEPRMEGKNESGQKHAVARVRGKPRGVRRRGSPLTSDPRIVRGFQSGSKPA